MLEVEERVTRMRHSFLPEVERRRQREPAILAKRRQKPKERPTFYWINGEEEVRK